MEICRHSHKLPEVFTHTHINTYEIMYCICGSYVFHYEKPDHTVVGGIVTNPKTMVFIPPNVPHGISVLEYPYERYFIQFSSRTTEKILDDAIVSSIFWQDAQQGMETIDQGEPRFLSVAATCDKVEEMLEKMYDIQFGVDMDEHWKSANLSSLFGIFLCELYRNYRSFFAQSLAQYTKPIQKAKNYIDEHYDQPITIKDIARECFLSPNYLSQCFHSQVGMSPRQYLTQLRMAMAKKLICSSQLPIQEIAMQAGFGDVNYFIQNFKSCYGTTPKQYRKTMIEEKIFD